VNEFGMTFWELCLTCYKV